VGACCVLFGIIVLARCSMLVFFVLSLWFKTRNQINGQGANSKNKEQDQEQRTHHFKKQNKNDENE
jgi:hypothetical protein